MIDQYDEAVQELDNIGILGTLTGAKVINEGFYEPGAVSLLFMYSYLWNEPFEPLPDCTNQSFGFEGQWTDTICNTIETLREACDAQESSCDPEAFQTVAAGTGDVIQASADRFASLLCLGSTDPQSGPSDDNMIAYCTNQDVIDSLQPNIVNLRAAVNAYVPGGFENIVFTKDVAEVATALFDLDEDGNAQADLSDPDGNLVIGDGRFKMNSIFFNNRSTHESIMAKTYAVKSVVFQYTYPLVTRDLINKYSFINGITEEQWRLFRDALTGYFFQEYADDLLTKWERRSTVQVFKKVSYTGCGEILGILAASRCGYKADDLLGLVEYYFSTLPEERPSDENSTEYVCSPFTWSHAKRAKKAMTTTKLNRRNPVPSHERCIEVLKLTAKE